MRVVIDKNVLISAIFFKGKPDIILDAWRNGKLEIILSPEILNEYSRVLHRLADKDPSIDTSGILYLLTAGCKVIEPREIESPVCEVHNSDQTFQSFRSYVATHFGANWPVISELCFH